MATDAVSILPQLLNGSTGDPGLFIDFPDRHDALLLDAGDNAALQMRQLSDLEAVFITHHHVDHFIGFDRIVRANIDSNKTLSVFGPVGTISKTYDRIKSYEYSYFPFQQIRLHVHEVTADSIRSAVFECGQKFPKPRVEASPRRGTTIFESKRLTVDVALTDHTVPGLAFSVTERPRWELSKSRLSASGLAAGPWIGEVQSAALARNRRKQVTLVDGTKSPVTDLLAQFFDELPGRKIAYIVDTAWSPAVRPALTRLARNADLLYCDSFYASEDRDKAEKYRHMTATDAADLARRAQVKELVLIHFSQRYIGRYQQLVDEAKTSFPRTSAEFS